ncbi:MAG: class I SAM-dependent methyltransferase, partial [Gammaproteobacteria bacterium]|nr:class I SAM-dependent methyltransferase [Gammaproteobacteria bacterium]
MEADGEAAPARRADQWLLTRLRAFLGDPPVAFAVRAGAHCGPLGDAAVARVTFADRRTLLSILADPPLRFGDAYSDGRVSIEGDLVQLLETVYRSGAAAGKPHSLLRRARGALRRPRRNTLSGSRDNIHHHYDIGNEFYSLWLGSTMAYTCAYYPTPQASLDEAQVAKMDHVCRKLRLRSGESVIEAGCGWGTLALHMARHYGVRVRAFNISHEQVAYAREHAAREGLAERVEYVEDDYRNIRGRCDAFVSVGMLEHVGVANYATLGDVARRALGGRGRGLIH